MVNNESCCFAKILKVIEILQNKSCNCESTNEGCDKPFLGPVQNLICYNTRPVSFYTRSGNLFEVSYTLDGTTGTSSTFRVEKVDDCCVKLRILAPDSTTGSYLATNSFVTVNLKCMCVLKCHDDLALENI